MIVGVGVLGGQLLDQLTMKFPGHRYAIVARNEDYLVRRVNLTKTVLAQWHLYPDVAVESCDIRDIFSFSQLITEHRPDIIFNATTPFPWWKISNLPRNLAELSHQTGPGIWCALDAALPLCIAKAIELSKVSTNFVNGCYPDVINAFLADHSSGPSIGIGNIANVVPGMRVVLAKAAGVTPGEVDVRLVCHHFTSLNAPIPHMANSAPFALWVRVRDRSLMYVDDDYPFVLLREEFPRLRGVAGQAVTVSSAAVVLSAFLSGSPRMLHAPGPKGLPGGYPVLIEEDGSVQLDLPPGLSLSEAIKINKRGQVLDGVACVVPGLLRPSAAAKEAFKKIVGDELPDITFDNVSDVADAAMASLNARYELGLS
jgi:hypothetical protein